LNARRLWIGCLAALVAVRLAIPLAALAASGHALPGLPRFDYVGLTGDATGFYAAIREFIASVPRLGKPLAALLALAVLTVFGLLFGLRRRRVLRPEWAFVLAALMSSLAVAAIISQMQPPGAAVFGWPLVWSLPLFPVRALGRLDTGVAWGFGLVLSLAANLVTLVSTAYLGLRATGRRSLGLLAAALYAFWPLLMGVVAGHRGWSNGSWEIDVGLHIYTEPLSTALVTGALAVLVWRRTPLPLAVAGVAFSLATLVKLSNGVLAAVVLAILVVCIGLRAALPYLAGALTFGPAVGAYWPKGYLTGTVEFPNHPFSFSYAQPNWQHSLLFSPRTLLVLLPVAALGALAVRSRFALLLLTLPVLANAAFYTFYRNTVGHPRFLFVSLPAVFVLWAAGAGTVALGLRKAFGEPVARRRGITIMTGR
jgi:hypothetical protein